MLHHFRWLFTHAIFLRGGRCLSLLSCSLGLARRDAKRASFANISYRGVGVPIPIIYSKPNVEGLGQGERPNRKGRRFAQGWLSGAPPSLLSVQYTQHQQLGRLPGKQGSCDNGTGDRESASQARNSTAQREGHWIAKAVANGKGCKRKGESAIASRSSQRRVRAGDTCGGIDSSIPGN